VRISKVAALSVLILPASAVRAEPVEAVPPKKFYRHALEEASTRKPPVSYKEMRRMLDAGEIILIDLRSPEEFLRAHLKGAKNLPLTDVTKETLAKVVGDPSKKIVIYCAQNLFPTRMVSLTLMGYPAIHQLGYENVLQMEEIWHGPKQEIEWEGRDGAPQMMYFGK